MAIVSLLLILVAAQLHSPTVAAHVASSSCIPHEREALLAFRRGIISDPWGNLASWQRGGEDCCKWKGVLCRNHTSYVLKLQLGSYYLVGQISHSLLSLEHLEHLDLSGNSLNGSSGGRIPEFLGSINSLKTCMYHFLVECLLSWATYQTCNILTFLRLHKTISFGQRICHG